MATNTLEDLVDAMNRIAPSHLAEEWDNVGLLLGERRSPVAKVLLCIDLTLDVVDEAISKEVDGVIAYHPPIFQPRRRITDEDAGGRILLALLQAGIGVHSPHTAADTAEGGVNDWLIAGVGSGTRTSLSPASSLPAGEACKIVTYAPRTAVDSLRRGMSAAGAGRIGNYESCAVEIEAMGTFRGNESSNPATGQRGRLERIEEVRLEMVCGRDVMAEAIARLRESHPYEEPPIEIYPQLSRPISTIGAGRTMMLEAPATTATVAQRLRDHLKTDRMTVSETAPRREHRRVGVCAGSGAELLGPAIEQGCTLFVTGELKHHDVLEARARSCDVILAGHTNTERGWLKECRTMLRRRLPDVEFVLSRADRDPLRNL